MYTHLVSALVSDKNYERPMILLDIVVNKNRYSRIELFPHFFRVFYCWDRGQEKLLRAR